MRADAQRNRERIVTAALDLFTERGAGASMEDVARAAGLGVGTLYRHFPDRQTLLEDIATKGLRQLLTFGQATAARDLPRWQVLRLVAEHSTEQPLALTRSLPSGSPARPERLELQREVDTLIAHIVQQAQKEGTLRGDIPPREVVFVLNTMVCRPGARIDDHLSTVILDGLRALPDRSGSSAGTA